jgi:hypothetical protein
MVATAILATAFVLTVAVGVATYRFYFHDEDIVAISDAPDLLEANAGRAGNEVPGPQEITASATPTDPSNLDAHQTANADAAVVGTSAAQSDTLSNTSAAMTTAEASASSASPMVATTSDVAPPGGSPNLNFGGGSFPAPSPGGFAVGSINPPVSGPGGGGQATGPGIGSPPGPVPVSPKLTPPLIPTATNPPAPVLANPKITAPPGPTAAIPSVPNPSAPTTNNPPGPIANSSPSPVALNVPGSSPGNPITPQLTLPDGTDQLPITACTGKNCNAWTYFDPIVAIGYNYQLKPSNPNSALTFGITDIRAVTKIGNGQYELFLFDVQSDTYVDVGQQIDAGPNGDFNVVAYLETLTAAQDAEFGVTDPDDGLSEFSLRGIDPSAGLDPSDPNAFITGLLFEGTIDGNLFITPLTLDTVTGADPVDPQLTREVQLVPEPGTIALLSGGLLGLAWCRRRHSFRPAGNQTST